MTERALTGVKRTAGNATGTSGRRTEGGCACSGLSARDVVETDRAQFTVQRRCCDRKAAGEEEVPRAETIYLGHEEQLERRPTRLACFQGQARSEEGLARAKAGQQSCVLPTPVAPSATDFLREDLGPVLFPIWGCLLSGTLSKLQASSATKSTDRSHHMSKMEKRRHRDPVRGVGPNFTSPPL